MRVVIALAIVLLLSVSGKALASDDANKKIGEASMAGTRAYGAIFDEFSALVNDYTLLLVCGYDGVAKLIEPEISRQIDIGKKHILKNFKADEQYVYAAQLCMTHSASAYKMGVRRTYKKLHSLYGDSICVDATEAANEVLKSNEMRQ